jgi:hypothetical protein
MTTFQNWLGAFLIVAGILTIGATLHEAMAHDHNRPELNAWFDQLGSKKGLCCSFADGEAVADADWESRDGHYRVMLPNKAVPGDPPQWVDVPDEALITEPNKDGRTMVWPIYGYGGMTIRCFMPGAMI